MRHRGSAPTAATEANQVRSAAKAKHPPLPMRDGVNPSCVYLPRDGQWARLLDFLLVRFPYMPADILRQRLAAGEMVNGDGRPYTLDSPFVGDGWLWYYREVPDEPQVPFDLEVLYQDELLLVVDKPHFLASTPGGQYVQETALTRLRRRYNNPDISPIHRLDRDTAGVLVFCVQAQYRGAYQQLFQQQQIDKCYEAIAPNPPAAASATTVATASATTVTSLAATVSSDLSTTQAPLHFPYTYRSHLDKSAEYFTMAEYPERLPNSETVIEQLQQGEQYSLYRLLPMTGKKHQLRVHMSALGMPICHDRYYPILQPQRAPDDFSQPLQLLARSIGFKDPITAQARHFESKRHLAYDEFLIPLP